MLTDNPSAPEVPGLASLHRAFAIALSNVKFASSGKANAALKIARSGKAKKDILYAHFYTWREDSGSAIQRFFPKYIELGLAYPNEVKSEIVAWAEEQAWRALWGQCRVSKKDEFHPHRSDSVIWWLAGAIDGKYDVNLPDQKPWCAPGWLAADLGETDKLVADWSRRLSARLAGVLDEEMEAARVTVAISSARERAALATRDNEHKERVAHERAVRLPATQVRSAPASMNREGDGRVKMLKIEQVREVALTFTWKDLETRFQEFQTKATGQKFSATFTRTDWESGDVSEQWIVGGNPVRRMEFEHLASIAARKLGYTASKEANEYWLNRVREWMQHDGLDKDKYFAWLPTGAVNQRGSIGTKQDLYTERIAELSAMFCMELMIRGTPESTVSQPTADMTHPRIGRTQVRPRDFTILAANLWKQKKGPNGRVSNADLKAIGDVLDSQKFTPPADYLEAKAAKELKARNSRTANSKNGGPIRTWAALAARGDKDELIAMRRLLIRCAAKQP